MTDILGMLQEKHGYLKSRGSLVRVVGETSDLRRIRDSRRRHWQSDPDLAELQDLMTSWLRHTDTPCPESWGPCEGCKAKRLNDAQSTFLRELVDVGEGAVGALRPGKGKTLVSMLAATVLGAKRALLIVPADLVTKTKRAMIQYARHYRIPQIHVISYQFLSAPNQLSWLTGWGADLIVCDEAGRLKSSSARCTKRIAKYLKSYPDTKFVALSGSITGRSIKENWHYTRWALRSRAPVPHDPLEMAAWAYAMDEKVPQEARFDPGALLSLSDTPEDMEPLFRARRAYGQRYTETPGVIATGDDRPAGIELQVSATELELGPDARQALASMRETWSTPYGEDFSLALDLWRHATTLGCGLYYRWDPAPPQDWMNARRAWHAFVGSKLAHSRTLDSVVHLVEGIEDGEIQDGGLYAAWKAVEPTFTPNPVPVWVHDHMLDYAQAWLAEHPKGLVWASQRAFGEELARRTGLPYFRSEGLDDQGRLIDEYTGGPAIASVKSCGMGHNLQFFDASLFTCPMTKGDVAEQALARTHREGQDAPQVSAEFVLTCRESYEALAQAYRDAQFAEEALVQPQRLIYSTKDNFGPILGLIENPNQELGA